MRTTAHAVSWPGYAPWADTVAACRAEFVRVARGFWLIPELIPPVARDDVALLYCFCRRLDDAVDEAPGRATARANLQAFADELHGQRPARPLIAAFVAGAGRSGLPLACADLLLEGMAFDLGDAHGHVTLEDDAALLQYAYRVSAAVGLMLAPLLGVSGEAARAHVVDLGLALQLSNILLGVEDDARRGRVYLPIERLNHAGMDPEGVLHDPRDPRLLPVRLGLSALSDRYYESAERGARFVPLRYRHGVILLGRFYGRLARRAARGQRVPIVPAGLPWHVKLAQLLELAAVALHPALLGFAKAPPHATSLHRGLARHWPGVDGCSDG